MPRKIGWKLSEETKQKMSLASKGKSKSKEHKENIKKSKLGNKNPMFGGNFSEEHKRKIGIYRIGKKHNEKTKQKMREIKIKNPNKVFKDTKIELKIEEELKKRNINYQKQVSLCKIAIVDFYLPEYRIVIQADGDYWHNKQGIKERDEKQNKVLTFNGFNVYRFWEHEINQSVENCINKISIK